MNKKFNLQPRAVISGQELADVLLVQSGFKSAAMVEISCPVRSSALTHKWFRERVREFEHELRAIGLRYKLHINYPKHAHAVTRFSYVARDERTLKKLIIADDKRDMYARRIALGTLLDYPRSAIQAFARNESLETKNIPRSVGQGKLRNFLNFRLSKSWRQEMGYVRSRARAIRKVSPELYKRIADQKRKRTV